MEKNPILDEAIRNFNIINFLDEQGVDYRTEGKNIGNGWIGVNNCPYCLDSNYHWGINLSRNDSKCWICGEYKSLVGIVSYILNIRYKDAIEYILQTTNKLDEYQYDAETQIKNIFKHEIETTYVENIKEVILPRNIELYKVIHSINFIKKFCNSRKITEKIARELDLRVGIDQENKGMLIIPVYFKKFLVAYQLRSMRIRFFKNIGKIKQCLYQYDTIEEGSTIFIVEGLTDHISTYAFFNKYRKNYTVTTPFSKIITHPQISLLESLKPKKVIFMLDNDAWYNYHETSESLTCDTDFIILPKFVDPGMLSTEEFLKIFENNNL